MKHYSGYLLPHAFFINGLYALELIINKNSQKSWDGRYVRMNLEVVRRLMYVHIPSAKCLKKCSKYGASALLCCRDGIERGFVPR